MAGRLLAIGDIHGCARALDALLDAIQPAADDCVVTLGDYVDRGPDSRGAIDRLVELDRRCRLVPLLGNHEKILLDLIDGQRSLIDRWVGLGGAATLDSFGCAAPELIPHRYVAFLRSCRSFYETEQHFYLHASYLPHLPLEQQPEETLYWESLRDRIPPPHYSGKTAVVGHTSQRSGLILDVGHLVCIDTACYRTGRLTALEPETGQLWQTNAQGIVRSARRGNVRTAGPG
jgi:serine/threonine protein phosphatase 1